MPFPSKPRKAARTLREPGRGPSLEKSRKDRHATEKTGHPSVLYDTRKSPKGINGYKGSILNQAYLGHDVAEFADHSPREPDVET